MKKDIKKLIRYVLAGLALLVLLIGAYMFQNFEKEHKEGMTKTDFALDTFVNISIYDKSDEKLLEEAIELCKHYENVFSAHKEGSELYALNHRSTDSVEVSEELAYLIERGLYYSKLTSGRFDITIEPVKQLWDFKAESPALPDKEAMEQALLKVDYNAVKVEGRTIHFTTLDTKIDLGAIAKGYIADKIKEFLISRGVKSAIINLGGNVLCIGKKSNNKDFSIGLQLPFATRQEVIGAVDIDDLSVVSSGVYERYITVDGKDYHHILDPKTGYPYDNDILGVSIISGSSMDGDALSTSCFALGVEEGLRLIDSLDGVYGYFILKDFSIVPSSKAPKLEK